MKYLILIYGDEAAMAQVPPEAQQAEMAKWFSYTQEMIDSGVYLAGEALHPTATASTVRAPAGNVVVTDGPFAETKEQLGGFYMIDVPSLDEALEWAKKCPGTAFGSIEVRPTVVFEEPPGSA